VTSLFGLVMMLLKSDNRGAIYELVCANARRTLLQVQRVNMLLWIGQRGLLFVVAQLLVYFFFMKRLNQTLFTGISRPVTYCWMGILIRKLGILVLQNFFRTMSPMLVLELQELCKHKYIY